MTKKELLEAPSSLIYNDGIFSILAMNNFHQSNIEYFGVIKIINGEEYICRINLNTPEYIDYQIDKFDEEESNFKDLILSDNDKNTLMEILKSDKCFKEYDSVWQDILCTMNEEYKTWSGHNKQVNEFLKIPDYTKIK